MKYHLPSESLSLSQLSRFFILGPMNFSLLLLLLLLSIFIPFLCIKCLVCSTNSLLTHSEWSCHTVLSMAAALSNFPKILKPFPFYTASLPYTKQLHLMFGATKLKWANIPSGCTSHNDIIQSPVIIDQTINLGSCSIPAQVRCLTALKVIILFLQRLRITFKHMLVHFHCFPYS